MSTRWEARLGSIVAAGGVIWTAQVATDHFTSLANLFPLPPGPMEVCAIGVLVWLHAKWRVSVQPR